MVVRLGRVERGPHRALFDFLFPRSLSTFGKNIFAVKRYDIIYLRFFSLHSFFVKMAASSICELDGGHGKSTHFM